MRTPRERTRSSRELQRTRSPYSTTHASSACHPPISVFPSPLPFTAWPTTKIAHPLYSRFKPRLLHRLRSCDACHCVGCVDRASSTPQLRAEGRDQSSLNFGFGAPKHLPLKRPSPVYGPLQSGTGPGGYFRESVAFKFSEAKRGGSSA